MDKYEYRLKAEQIEKLVKKKDYKTAVKIADTIDWRRVKNLNMLYIVADLYEEAERYEDCMEILSIAYDRAPVGRMLLYKMTEIATKTHNFEEAISLYQEFVKAAPHDQSKFILKYQIYRERGSSLEDQIKILREYKTHEYQEKWAYELASLYDQAGMQEDCVRECDELILWFSEGEYVTKAMELKMKYEPLTPVQQDKYNHRYQMEASADVVEDDYDETEVNFNTDKFSTINLQAELAANLDEMLQQDTDADIDIPEIENIPEVDEPASEVLEPAELKMEGLIPEELEPEPIEEPVLEEIEPEPIEEPVVKQVTGRIEIDKILQLWDNKKTETEAALKAKEPEEAVRKEKVRQETAELVKLISGTSDDIPEDVQQILKDLDEEQKQAKSVVTEDDLPKDIDALDELEDLTIQELTVPEDIAYPAEPDEDMDLELEKTAKPESKEKISSETSAMNMIQELEKTLSREVADLTIKAGHLTREQARIFTYFTVVRGVGEQLAALFKGEAGSSQLNSSSGNVVITGESGNGKTTLAIDIVKALQKLQRVEGKKLAKISGKKLNSKDIYETLAKLKGGSLIIEKAGALSDASMMALSLAMEGDTGGLLIILEDKPAEIQKLFHRNANFASKFEYKVDIPVFSNDELIAFAKAYAMEQGFSYDEFAVLALYDRIGNGQTNDHKVSVAEVKEIVDSAIEHAEKGGVRRLFAKITGKSVDEDGYRLLHEQDFEA